MPTADRTLPLRSADRPAPGRIPGFLAALGLACGCGGGDGGGEATPSGGAPSAGDAPVHALDLAAAPNVVLISIDTLRADHLGTYGYERDTSPRIDALGAEGAVFERCASSTSWTLPAHAAMLTGLSDLVHGCFDTDRQLAPSRVTLAERLAAVGYRTAGFWSGPYLHPVFGLGQGFETWVDCTSYAAVNDAEAEREGRIEGDQVWKRANDDVTNPRVLERAGAWLDGHADERFFLFLHLWDCHFDFIPPAPYDTMFDPDYEGSMTGEDFFFDPAVNAQMDRRDLEHLIALYDGEIRWTDLHVGYLLDALERHGVAEDTLVVVTSDHGTGFFEHGTKAHRNGLWDELIHVPLVMRLPGRIPAGTRVPEQVRLIDIVPTVLELVGVPLPNDVMGRSLGAAFAGELAPTREPALSELYTLGQNLRTYRRVDRKIHMVMNDPRKVTSLVFDLEADPGERQPMTSAQHPVSQRALADRELGFHWLSTWQEALPVDRATSDIPADVLRQLEGFGYVGGDREVEAGGR